MGSTVVWIGGSPAVTPLGGEGSFKQDILDDILGRVNFAAGVLITLRPFMHAIWAVFYSKEGRPPTTTTIWSKQIEHALSWLRAFFRESIGGFRRCFYLQ